LSLKSGSTFNGARRIDLQANEENCMTSKAVFKMRAPRRRERLIADEGEMTPRIIKARAPLALRIALLLLGAAVFAWGLQYKLSLYSVSTHRNQIPVAKLIQGEQTNKKIAAIHLRSRCKCSESSPVGDDAAFHFSTSDGWNRWADRSAVSSITQSSGFLFSRPPPQAS